MPARITREGRMNRELAKFERALPGALAQSGLVIVTRAQHIFATYKPRGTATGRTVRSITVSPPEMVGSGAMRVRVGPTTKYSWWLHFGRKPGKRPPIQAILDWVREKHLSGVYSIRTHRRMGSRSMQEAEDLAAAFAIANSIARKGTRPFPFLAMAFRLEKHNALRVFVRSLLAGVARG